MVGDVFTQYQRSENFRENEIKYAFQFQFKF